MGATFHHIILIHGLSGMLVMAIGTPVVVAQTQVIRQSPSRTESLDQQSPKRLRTPVAQVSDDLPSPHSQRAPLSESHDALRRPLARRRQSPTVNPTHGSSKGIWTVALSLALVLGVLATFVWISRRAGWTHSQTLPDQAIRVLGSAALDARHQLRLVRIGNRIVALAVSATSVQSIAEIREPEEVARLTLLCNNGSGPAVTELVNTDYSTTTRLHRDEVPWDPTTTETRQQRNWSLKRG